MISLRSNPGPSAARRARPIVSKSISGRMASPSRSRTSPTLRLAPRIGASAVAAARRSRRRRSRCRATRSEEHTSELQSRQYLVCRLLLEKKKKKKKKNKTKLKKKKKNKKQKQHTTH